MQEITLHDVNWFIAAHNRSTNIKFYPPSVLIDGVADVTIREAPSFEMPEWLKNVLDPLGISSGSLVKVGIIALCVLLIFLMIRRLGND